MKKLKIAALLCLLCLLTAGCAKEKKVKNKTVTLEYQNKKYEGQYTGLMKNDKPTKGTFPTKREMITSPTKAKSQMEKCPEKEPLIQT